MKGMENNRSYYPQTIKDWPEDERPRERLIMHGAESLSNAELLAIILRTGDASTKKTALDHARALLNRFKGFRAIGNATIAELCEFKGIGVAKAAQIMAAMEIARRFSSERLEDGIPFRSSRDVFNHFHERLRDKKKEIFIVLLLDGKNRRIKDITVSQGSLTASLVHPREVFNPVVRESAASIILVHNHPSGDPQPSVEDREITARLKDVGDLLGIKVLDHVIIGSGRYMSFADEGWFK